MLKIYYGDLQSDNYINNPDVFFNNSYEDEWITNSFSRKVIQAIDGSEVKGSHFIESPFLGGIPVERLSGGVKTLILMKFDSRHIFNASACGDNCASWILAIAQEKDLTIRLGYLMDFGAEPFEIEIINKKQIVYNQKELVETVLDNHLI